MAPKLTPVPPAPPAAKPPTNGATPPAATVKPPAANPPPETPPAATVPPTPETPPATPPVDPVAAMINETAAALAAQQGIALDDPDFALIRQLAESQVGRWAKVKVALESAVGPYRQFASITIRTDGDKLVIERNIPGAKSASGSAKRSANHDGSAQFTPKGQSTKRGACNAKDKAACPCDDSGDALRQQYRMKGTEFESAAQMAFAAADGLAKTRPEYNQVPRWLRDNAHALYLHAGYEGDKIVKH